MGELSSFGPMQLVILLFSAGYLVLSK